MPKSYLKLIFLMYIVSFCITLQPIVGSSPRQSESMQLNASWWDNTWSHRIEVTVNNQGYTLNNYPVLLKTSDDVLYEFAKEDGADIRFVTENKQQLEYFIEKWNTSGESNIWVKIPRLSDFSEIIFYLYFGNTAAEAQSDESSTFLLTDNFSTNEWEYNNQSMINHDAVNERMKIHTNNQRIDDYAFRNKGSLENREMRFQLKIRDNSENQSQIYIGFSAINEGVINNITFGIFLQIAVGNISSDFKPILNLLVIEQSNYHRSSFYFADFETIFNVHLRAYALTTYLEIWDEGYNILLHQNQKSYPFMIDQSYLYVCGGYNNLNSEGHAELDNIKLRESIYKEPIILFAYAKTYGQNQLSWIIPVSIVAALSLVLGIVFLIRKKRAKSLVSTDKERPQRTASTSYPRKTVSISSPSKATTRATSIPEATISTSTPVLLTSETMINDGHTYFNKAMFGEALTCWKNALRLKLWDKHLGLITESAKDATENKGHAFNYAGKIIQAVFAGDFGTAKINLQKYLEIQPKNISLLNFLAWCYITEENYKEAIECFEKSLEIEPDQLIALEFIAILLNDLGEVFEILKHMSDLLLLEPNELWYWRFLIYSSSKRGVLFSYENTINGIKEKSQEKGITRKEITQRTLASIKKDHEFVEMNLFGQYNTINYDID